VSWPPKPSRSGSPWSSGRTRAAATCPRRARPRSTWRPMPPRSPPSSAPTSSSQAADQRPVGQEVGRGLRQGRHQGRTRSPTASRPSSRAPSPAGRHRHLLGRRGQGHRRRARRRTGSAPPGGSFGHDHGRNSFQRPHDEAVKLLQDVMDVHREGPAPGAVTGLTDAAFRRAKRNEGGPLARAARPRLFGGGARAALGAPHSPAPPTSLRRTEAALAASSFKARTTSSVQGQRHVGLPAAPRLWRGPSSTMSVAPPACHDS